jgi:hypothetical protein
MVDWSLNKMFLNSFWFFRALDDEIRDCYFINLLTGDPYKFNGFY